MRRKDRYPESSVPADRQDAFGVRDVVAGYDVGAPALVPEYERLSFEEIHASVLALLPDCDACILDVGAGTGRDAAWFAANGHNVVAVEPSAPGAPGLYLAVMYSGVMMAPVVGRLATDEIVAGREAEALALCRLSRFG